MVWINFHQYLWFVRRKSAGYKNEGFTQNSLPCASYDKRSFKKDIHCFIKSTCALFSCSTLLFISACSEQASPSSITKKQQLKGVDVSHYQGNINWPDVVNNGIAFTFIKATQGENTVDAKFNYNWQASKKANIRRGAYHYLDPSIDAKKQAQHFLATTGGNFGELPPVVDIEAFEKQSAEQLLADLNVYLTIVSEAANCAPIIYTSPDFWDELNSHSFGEYPLWLAQYSKIPRIPNGWKNWTFWQFESNGKVNGIDGQVDVSYFAQAESALDVLSCQRS